LALRSTEVADMTSRCEGLKEVGATDRAKVCPLAHEVRRLKAEADLREEEMRQMKGNLRAVAVKRDESRCQVAEASPCIDSLSKHLEAERFEGRALKAWIGGILLKSCLIFLGSISFSGYRLMLLSSFQASRRI
jgi:outer membrane murein-binding lipoprotein Lpp